MNIRGSFGGPRWILKVSHYWCLFTDVIFLSPVYIECSCDLREVTLMKELKGKQTVNAANLYIPYVEEPSAHGDMDTRLSLRCLGVRIVDG